MSQHDMNIANQGFPAFRADLNDALAALASTSTGATEPSTTFAQQLWYDSTANLLKMRNTDNDAWITLAYFDQTNDEWEIRSAVIQAVDSAGVSIKTDDGTTRISVSDAGVVSFENYSFPSADGSANQIIETDGSGNLSFVDKPSGGKVLQVVSTTKTDTFTTTSTSFTDITGLSASITPSSASSKILVLANVSYSNQTSNNYASTVRLVRDSTPIGNGSGADNRPGAIGTVTPEAATGDQERIYNASSAYLDSPSTTSATTYKIQILARSSSTACVNKTSTDRNDTFMGRFSSTVTVMEIAG